MKIASGINLNEEECCALANAFANNPETVRDMCKLMDSELLRKSAEILLHTTRLFRPPHLEIDEAYAVVATAELKRLEAGLPHLRCAHTTETHRMALHSVVSKFSLPAA